MIAMPRGPFGSKDHAGGQPRAQSQSLKVVGATSGRRKARRVFDSVEHLSAEAVAGYVDNELPAVAMNRARTHLVHCAECRAEVIAQRRASDRLRQSAEEEITAPSSLIAKLSSIAQSCPEGPRADDLPKRRGEDIVARVETFYRAVKKAQGK